MRKLGKFIFGAFLGAFIGSSIVILFTPESGEDTREAIGIRFGHLAEQIKEAIAARKAELLEEIEKYKESAT